MYTTGHLKRQMCGVWAQGCSGGAVFSYGPWALIDVLFWFSESHTHVRHVGSHGTTTWRMYHVPGPLLGEQPLALRLRLVLYG